MAAFIAASLDGYIAREDGDVGGLLIQSFLAEGLMDELTITRIPVLLGGGIPLFGPLPASVTLTHVRTRAYPNGFVQTTYAAAPGAQPPSGSLG